MNNILTKAAYYYYSKIVKKRNLVIAIDFDGTITENGNDWPEVGQLKENAKEVINYLHDQLNCTIIIWTCRTDGVFNDMSLAKEFLAINNIHYDYFNENDRQIVKRFGFDSRKVSADIFIDDKAMLGHKLDWLEVKEYIQGFKKENYLKYY